MRGPPESPSKIGPSWPPVWRDLLKKPLKLLSLRHVALVGLCRLDSVPDEAALLRWSGGILGSDQTNLFHHLDQESTTFNT